MSFSTSTAAATDRGDRYIEVATPADPGYRQPITATWESEKVRIVSGLATNFWECDRGIEGTFATPHPAGSLIALVLPDPTPDELAAAKRKSRKVGPISSFTGGGRDA